MPKPPRDERRVVTLSAAKGLERCRNEILRSAQNDLAGSATAPEGRPLHFRCPRCRTDLDGNGLRNGETDCPGCGRTYSVVGPIVDFNPQSDLTPDVRLSLTRWSAIYESEEQKQATEHLRWYRKSVFDNVCRQSRRLPEVLASGRRLRALELGSGRSEWSYWMGQMGHEVVAVDFCRGVLRDAANMFRAADGPDCTFVCANMCHLPFPDQSFDFAYGGGVIEHVSHTGRLLKEVSRILVEGGLSLNTVPAFSLSTLFLKHNHIPDVPLLRGLAEHVHLNILKGRLLDAGYELSFTRPGLARLHAEAGLTTCHAGRYDVGLASRGRPRSLRGRLAMLEPFWDVLLIEAIKDSAHL